MAGRPTFPTSRLGSVVEEVWGLAWPAIAHLSLITTVFVTDRAMVGHHSETALAAMHGATTLSWTLCSVLGAVSIGALATVGRKYGAGGHDRTAGACRTALRAAAGAGAIFAALLWATRAEILRALFAGAGPAALELASSYLSVVLPAVPFGLYAMTAASCLHGMRDTRTPLRAALVGNAVNVLVSAHLIFGLWGLPELGVVGAGIGTSAAFVTQAWMLFRALDLGQARPAPIRELWDVTWPVLGERLAFHGAYVAYAAMIATLGPLSLAAHQGLLAVEAIGFTIAEGFGVAAAALAANHVGAGRTRQAHKSAFVAAGLAALALTTCSLIYLAVATPLIELLCCDGVAAHHAVSVLPIVAASQPFIAVAVVLCAALRGSGRTRAALAITLGCAVVVRLLASWWWIGPYGLSGAWLAAAMDWAAQVPCVLGVLAVGYWRDGRRMATVEIETEKHICRGNGPLCVPHCLCDVAQLEMDAAVGSARVRAAG